jgi:UDP-glucose 4-epimerase
MRLLVTGGAGYIGSHTVVELIEAGHDVEVLDTLVNARPSVLERIGAITGRTPTLHRIDLRDRDAVATVVSGGGFDAVIHFAALKAVADSIERPVEYYDVNVGGTTILLDSMERAGIRRLVFSSSATVSGTADDVPLAEDTPLEPATNPYGRSKQMVESILRDLFRAHPNWSIAVLRYFNPVGAHASGLIGEDPRGPASNLMPAIARVAAGRTEALTIYGDDYPTRDGTAIRDYIHVMDLATGHLAALDACREPGHHVWNLGTGVPTSVRELVDTFSEVNGVEVPVRMAERRAGDLPEAWADPGLAERELGWRAVRGLEEMCRDTWRWQQQASNHS